MKLRSILLYGAVALAGVALANVVIKNVKSDSQNNLFKGKLSPQKLKDLYAEVEL